MLSDEEKKAIEILKDREYDFDELYCTFRQSFIKQYDKSIGIILNLIEKQSKEIEVLKDTNKKLYEMGKQNAIQELINNEYISKDKIKARIEELDKEEKEVLKGTKGQDRYAIKQEYMHKRSGLQSLLEKE